MLRKYFEFEKLKTDFKTEITAGFVTFATMAYLLVLIPMMLSGISMPIDAVFTASVLIAGFGSILTGLYTKRPFGLAPYIGECAFVTYTVVGIMGYTWQEALGAIFICGILLFIMTLLNIRSWLVKSIPQTLKLSFIAGLGLFLILAGLKQAGIVEITKNALILGDISDIHVVLGIICLLMMIILSSLKVKSSILISIISITVVGIILKDIELPSEILSFSIPSVSPIFLKFDILNLLNTKGFVLIFTFFILIFTDTMGSLIGISYKANLLDKEGNLPEIKKPMLVDSISTVLASLLGTTTSGYCAESVTGIEAGGKSGLTSVVVGILFLVSVIFAPLLGIIPVYAYAPAIIIVGILMSSSLSNINYDDFTEYLPAIIMISLILFTSNFGVGMAAGFILYPILKVLTKRNKENNLGIWILFVASILFFIFCR